MRVSYLDFLRRIGVTPEPGQRVACAVAFDGVDPADLEGEDRELARLIFGASERFAVSPGLEAEGYLELPGGASGHPLSPFYRSGFDDWALGRPTPFLPGPPRHKLTLQ